MFTFEVEKWNSSSSSVSVCTKSSICFSFEYWLIYWFDCVVLRHFPTISSPLVYLLLGFGLALKIYDVLNEISGFSRQNRNATSLGSAFHFNVRSYLFIHTIQVEIDRCFDSFGQLLFQYTALNQRALHLCQCQLYLSVFGLFECR